MWNPCSLMASESTIDKYLRYRALGKALHAKIVTHPAYGEFLVTATTHLGYRAVRGEIAIDESEIAIVFDYAQYEILQRGKNFIQIYRDSTRGHSRQELEILEAWSVAQTGLYQIVDADVDDSQVTAQDLTNPDCQVVLTDIGLSLTYSQRLESGHSTSNVVFLRPLFFKDFVMTSGFACPFPGSEERALLKLWDKYEGSTRFASIARHYKSKGYTLVLN